MNWAKEKECQNTDRFHFPPSVGPAPQPGCWGRCRSSTGRTARRSSLHAGLPTGNRSKRMMQQVRQEDVSLHALHCLHVCEHVCVSVHVCECMSVCVGVCGGVGGGGVLVFPLETIQRK